MKKGTRDAQAFVQAVMATCGLKTTRDLARALGRAGTDAERQVGRWANGTNAPSFDVVIDLLILADWLKPAALRVLESPEQAPTADESEQALRSIEPVAQRPAEIADRPGTR